VLKCGVPQSSVRGPLLLLIHVNNLLLSIEERELVLFADNINWLVIERDENILQRKVKEDMKKLEYCF